MANRLAAESSPYLRKHADQAIDWRPWGEEAFALARAENKPILVSIGYLACFWCHVMAQEAYADPRVVAVLTNDFVAIKVDREERPDVDRGILDGLARLGARTGWPINAFLRADGTLYAGGSYYPPEPRHGLPGFLDVLADARRKYDVGDTEPSRGTGAVAAPSSRGAASDLETYARFLGDRLLENVDTLYGGFGQNGPRFPQPSLHELLWRRHMTSGSAAFGEATTQSMSRICRSALYDHVGGGFHRYCVDDAWTIPHFEKMLYDNAQLVELLTFLWRGTKDRLFASRVAGTLDWAIAEMRTGPGFASSLGAYAEDGLSEAEGSGRYYRWDKDEIAAALGDDAGLVHRYYEVCPMGGHASGALQMTEVEVRAGDRDPLARSLAALAARRAERPRPARDDKVMLDWNGLMIAALVEAGAAFERRDWLKLAIDTFDGLVEAAGGEDGSLRHCLIDGAKGPDAFLEDYATMARAALRLHEAFGKRRTLDLAQAWVARLDGSFWDDARGGYFMSAAGGFQPTARTRTIAETSLPSGNALMIGVLARLHALTGEGRYQERAEALVEAFRTDIPRYGQATATAVNSITTLARFVKITVSGQPGEAATRELLAAALGSALPDRMVLGPGAGVEARNGVANGQVCVGTSCLMPVSDAAALAAMLAPGGLAQA